MASTSSSEKYKQHVEAGDACVKSAQYRDALSHYNGALSELCQSQESDTALAILRNSIALCHFQLKEYKECIEVLDPVLSMEEDESGADFDHRQQWYEKDKTEWVGSHF